MDKQKQTQVIKKWTNDYDKLCSLVDMWHRDFLKQDKEKHDFSFKLYGYARYACFTIFDEKIEFIKDSQKVKTRQEKHMRVFRLFSMYLYKGFLEESELFPKCLYEK